MCSLDSNQCGLFPSHFFDIELWKTIFGNLQGPCGSQGHVQTTWVWTALFSVSTLTVNSLQMPTLLIWKDLMHLVSMQVPHKRKPVQVPSRWSLMTSDEGWLKQYLKHCLTHSIYQMRHGNSASHVIIVQWKLLRMLEGELAFSKMNLILTCCTSVLTMHYQDFLILPRKNFMLNSHTEDESAWNSQDGTIWPCWLLAFRL